MIIMTSVHSLKFLFAFLLLATILLAGIYPFRRQKSCTHNPSISLSETLATGIFLGAGLLHMLPDSMLQFHQLGCHYPFAPLVMGGTFLMFLWFEHIGQALYHPAHDHTLHSHDPHPSPPSHTHPAFAILAWAMLSIHSFILGTALGLNDNQSIVVMLFLAIIAHKWAESFALAVQLNQSKLSAFARYSFFLSFALMTPFGIFFGYAYDLPQQASFIHPLLMAISAGTFLYLGTLHGLDRCVLVTKCCNLADFSFVIIGFLLMAGAALYV